MGDSVEWRCAVHMRHRNRFSKWTVLGTTAHPRAALTILSTSIIHHSVWPHNTCFPECPTAEWPSCPLLDKQQLEVAPARGHRPAFLRPGTAATCRWGPCGDSDPSSPFGWQLPGPLCGTLWNSWQPCWQVLQRLSGWPLGCHAPPDIRHGELYWS